MNVHSTMRQAHGIVRIDVREWNQMQEKVGRCGLETGGECEIHAPVTTHVPGGHPASSPSCPASPPEHAQSFTRFGAPRMHCFSSSSRLHSPRYCKQERVKEGYPPLPNQLLLYLGYIPQSLFSFIPLSFPFPVTELPEIRGRELKIWGWETLCIRGALSEGEECM